MLAGLKMLFRFLVTWQVIVSANIVNCNLITIGNLPSYIIDSTLIVPISVQVDDPPAVLIANVYVESSVGPEIELFRRRYILHKHSCVTVSFNLPRKYLNFNSRNLNHATDFFAKGLRSNICILDKEKRNCVTSKELNITLPKPWERREFPPHSAAWSLEMIKRKQERKIPLCPDIADVVELTSTPLAISGKPEQGFIKKLQPIKWPSHVPERIRETVTSTPRFTLSFWAYVSEPCQHAFCEMLSHRDSLKFLTPVVLLTKSGFVHVQVHNNEGAGEAFLTHVPVHLKQWFHVVLSVNGHEALLSIGHTNGTYQKYSHKFNSLGFRSDVGVWNIGGYFGFPGIRGMLCCVKLHRRKTLNPEEIKSIEDDKRIIQNFDVSGLSMRCALIRQRYSFLWRKYVLPNTSCTKSKQVDLFSKRRVQHLQCRRRYRVPKYLKNTFYLLESFFKTGKVKDLSNRILFAKQLSILGLNKIILHPSNATRLLEISGCLGYLESFLLSSVSIYFSSQNSSEKNEAVSKLIYAAMHDNELAQLALSYRHQLGIDGMTPDLNIAAAYSKAAAISVKKILENEQHSIHTHSELIRLDEAHLFAGKRGMSSDVMKWLKRQADWGSLGAQSKMADILFHGQHGVDAQRNEAVHLYRAGAEQGDPNSLYNLGVLHLRGIEVDKNETKAVELFSKAAKKNYTIAYNSLGYHELVNKKNISGALHFWRLAADLGDKDAMTNLAIQYENGIVDFLESNKTKAFNLFKRAAEQGQRDGCIKYADYLITGEAGVLNSFFAIRFYRYVAEQLPTIGLYLRNAFGSYEEGNWNTSLVMYMIVAESGLALGSFNAALLCDEMQRYHMNTGSLGSNCSLHFFNISASLGWPASIVQMGDEYWYGGRVRANLTKAVMNYIWITNDQDSPQALFNLGYLLENNATISGIDFGYKPHSGHGHDKKELAKRYYQRCQKSSLNNGDGFYPCTIALMNMKLKSVLHQHKMTMVFIGIAVAACFLVAIFADDEI